MKVDDMDTAQMVSGPRESDPADGKGGSNEGRVTNGGARRRRRRPGEVDRLIAQAARGLFASKGYAGTSTREIAELAGTHEPTVYRRFGSKAQLFEKVVLEPFNEVISEYLAVWQSQRESPATTEDLVRQFVLPLYTVLTEHRKLKLALIAAHAFNLETRRSSQEDSELSRMLDRLEPQLSFEATRRGLRKFDPSVTLRVSAGMVMAMAILDRWLLPHGGRRPSREQIIEEMVQFCLYGVSRPADAGHEYREGDTGDEAAPKELSPDISKLLDKVADAERRAVRAELELLHLKAQPRVERTLPAQTIVTVVGSESTIATAKRKTVKRQPKKS
jgi:AcrR family transcriptional regulator